MALRVPAIGRPDRQRIIIIDVAQIAGYVGMPIREREAGSAVVKYSRGPGGYRVAGRAGRCRRRETGHDVIRYRSANGGGAIKFLLVAPVAIRRIE